MGIGGENAENLKEKGHGKMMEEKSKPAHAKPPSKAPGTGVVREIREC